MEKYSVTEKKKILPFVITQLGLEGIILKEVSQTEKDKHCYDLTHIWNLRKQTNKEIQRIDWFCRLETGWVSEISEGGQKVVMYSKVAIVNNTILHV